MTTEEKAAKYDEIAEALWTAAMYGNLLQSTVAAGLIRQLNIFSPDGDSPENA